MGRSTRGTRVITSLKCLPASIWRIRAGSGAQPTEWAIGWVGTTPGRVWMRPPGGHGECPRRNHGEAAGTKWGSSPVERTAVNVGTVSVLTHHPGCQHGSWVGSTVDRSGGDGTEPP